jgi:hypothetical protein
VIEALNRHGAERGVIEALNRHGAERGAEADGRGFQSGRAAHRGGSRLVKV